jgi:hypothetical protein
MGRKILTEIVSEYVPERRPKAAQEHRWLAMQRTELIFSLMPLVGEPYIFPEIGYRLFSGDSITPTLFQEICWVEPRKQKTRSCRTQELARSRARKMSGGKRNLPQPVRNCHQEQPTISSECEKLSLGYEACSRVCTKNPVQSDKLRRGAAFHGGPLGVSATC